MEIQAHIFVSLDEATCTSLVFFLIIYIIRDRLDIRNDIIDAFTAQKWVIVSKVSLRTALIIRIDILIREIRLHLILEAAARE